MKTRKFYACGRLIRKIKRFAQLSNEDKLQYRKDEKKVSLLKIEDGNVRYKTIWKILDRKWKEIYVKRYNLHAKCFS